jgi:uncharacterized protein
MRQAGGGPIVTAPAHDAKTARADLGRTLHALRRPDVHPEPEKCGKDSGAFESTARDEIRDRASPYRCVGNLERGLIMGQPVVHFEIIGTDPEKLRGYYGDLFGWQFDTPSPVAQEVSEPEDYGSLDLMTSEDGTGIRGGVGGGQRYESHAVFYVGVADVEAALQRAESLGGIRVMGPATSPNGLVVGHFTDPEGTLIGVAGVA